ncbi:hypothetical protein RB195_025204 [Necator americanus]|uniref:Uncharacterized protein n=1 Tax=Necator americanus TaxID=51031 RepID=A0ABR1ER98_NECAM
MEIGKITQHLQAMGIPVHFGHIATQHYAADCATRGLTQTELADHIWWTGPAILHDPPKSWSSTLWTFDYDTGFENEHQDATTNKKESEVIEPLEELKEVLLTKNRFEQVPQNRLICFFEEILTSECKTNYSASLTLHCNSCCSSECSKRSSN